MAICLPCGMEVDEMQAKFTSEYEGTAYYFCGPGCKRAFDAEPERYVKGEAGGGHRHHSDWGLTVLGRFRVLQCQEGLS